MTFLPDGSISKALILKYSNCLFLLWRQDPVVGDSLDYGVRWSWVPVPALPFTGTAMSGQSLSLSKSEI